MRVQKMVFAKLVLAGLSAFVAYAFLAYTYTAHRRVGPRNPFAARPATPGHIPQWLIKTGPLPANTTSVRVLLELARARNHGRVQVRYFTDVQSREHVRAHCGERALAAYDTLVPGSYKADLFRYCILWSDGGVYGDLAHRYHVPLHELVDFERDDLVLARDRLMYNHHVLAHPGVTPMQISFMAATPRHPLLKLAIDEVIKNVEARYYGRSELDITGPFLMGRLVSTEAAKPAGEGLLFRLELEEVGNAIASIATGAHVIATKEVQKEVQSSLLANRPRYSDLWWRRRVYKGHTLETDSSARHPHHAHPPPAPLAAAGRQKRGAPARGNASVQPYM